jgi:hypothetical protein
MFMPQNGVQVAIATNQLLANLIPLQVLQPAVCWLLVSESMAKSIDVFGELVEKKCPDTQLVIREGLPDAGAEKILDFLLSEDEAIKQAHPEMAVDYNATGGTKLMAIIAYQVFSSDPANRVLYASTERNEIEVVEPQSEAPIAIELANDEETYLLAYGLIRRKADSDNPVWRETAQSRKTLTYYLAKNCQRYGNAFSLINGAASRCEKSGTKHQPVTKIWGEAKALLNRLNDESLLQWSAHEPSQIYFHDRAYLTYLSGGWLEEYVWITAQACGFDELSAGRDITTREEAKKNIRNELDCVITHNNRLLVIECKSGRFGLNDQKDSDILNKLESLGRRAGGVMGSALLVSAQPLNRVNKGRNQTIYTAERAKLMGVAVLEEQHVSALQNWLETWRDTGHFPSN